MKAWIGKIIIVIGMLHTFFGFVFFHEVISVIFKEGLFNTVNQQPEREAMFWFLFAGFTLVLFGVLINWIERNQTDIPVFFFWGFFSLTIVGAFIMPISGFWLLFVPIVGMFLRGKTIKEIA